MGNSNRNPKLDFEGDRDGKSFPFVNLPSEAGIFVDGEREREMRGVSLIREN